MFTRFFAIAPLVIILWGCAGTVPQPERQAADDPPPTPVTPMTLTKADLAIVEAGIRSVLKDPESARFGRTIAGTDAKGAIVVCLMVNAKNSYGGYTGEKPFMGVLARERKSFLVVPTDGRLEHSDSAIYTVCANNGLSLAGA